MLCENALAIKFATLLKVTLLHGCLSRFLTYTNGTKSHNISHTHKNKLYKNNKAEIVKKIKTNLEHFKARKFRNKKLTLLCHVTFEN